MKKRIAMSWSGGKDACLALHHLLQSETYEIDHLHTVVGEETNRVGMHGIKKELIEAQAKSLNIPLIISYLPSDSNNDSYEEVMRTYADYCKSKNISTIAFGDILLADLKKYREENMAKVGMDCLFPLWNQPTKELIHAFIDLGYKTKICAADAAKISKEQVGKTITKDWIHKLAADVDPCGENGEFHSFVFDGPLFQHPIPITLQSIDSHFYEYEIEVDGEIKSIKSEFYFAEYD